MSKAIFKLTGIISVKIFYSLISVIMILVFYMLLLGYIGYFLGIDPQNRFAFSAWIRHGSLASLIFIFPSLTCIWADTIKSIKANDSSLKFSKKLKLWFISTCFGFVAYIILQLIASFVLRYHFIAGGLIGWGSVIIGLLVAQIHISIKLKLKIIKSDCNTGNDQEINTLENKGAEVTALQQALTILKNLKNQFHYSFHMVEIIEETSELFCSHPESITKMQEDERSFEVIIYRYIITEIKEKLESGELHAHMIIGALSGSGQLLLDDFDQCVDKLVILGDITKEESRDIKSSVRGNIKLQRR